MADRPDLVAQTSHDHTHVLFNRVCGCHWKLLQNPAQITSLAPLWAGASVSDVILVWIVDGALLTSLTNLLLVKKMYGLDTS